MSELQKPNMSVSEGGKSTLEDAPKNITVTTPPGWRVLPVSDIPDLAVDMWTGEGIEGLDEGLPRMLARMSTAAVDDANILFAAVSIAGEAGCEDMTSFTIAVPRDNATRTHNTGDTGSTHAETTTSSGIVAQDSERAASYENVVLNAGPAARTESYDFVELGPPMPRLPVFCVVYGVGLPHTDRPLILTFTTVAPSDPDMLRAQFADIAGTLAFS
jgi:hypothetical protein